MQFNATSQLCALDNNESIHQKPDFSQTLKKICCTLAKQKVGTFESQNKPAVDEKQKEK